MIRMWKWSGRWMNCWNYDAFLGFETETWINSGLGTGCLPQHRITEALLQPYVEIKPAEDGTFTLTPCPRLNTEALLPYGLKQDGTRQTVCGAEILPVEYLNPYDDPTGKLNKTNNTYSIHWFGKSWMNKRTILRSRLTRPIHRIFGIDALAIFSKKKP